MSDNQKIALMQMNAICLHQTDRRENVNGMPVHTVMEGSSMPLAFHPLTCGNNSNHTPLYPFWTGEKIILICRDCDYVQNNSGMFK